ncbi:MAG: methyl-accepting chemotaxis protein [Desulfomonilia bacterium]
MQMEVGGKLKGTSLASEEYFLIAKNGTPNIGKVTRSASTSKLIVPVSAPIFSDKKSCLGCVILFVQIDSILNKIRAAKIGQSGYAFMIDACALVLEHANPDYVLQHTINDTPGMEGIARKMTAQEKGIVEYVSGSVEYVAGIAPVPITGWSIGATQPRREFLAPVHDIRTIIMVVGAITLAVATLFIVLFARSITNPLSKGVQIAKNMADGDFSQSIDVKQTDEIGVLADALRNTIDRLGNFITMVKNASQHVDLASEEVSSGTQGLSRATQVQATAIEQIAATIEEFASTTKQNASNAGRGLKKSQDTKKVLHTNMDIGKKLSEAMNDISQVSGKIEEIISTVNEVAFQTNLLALNAAVEAARAGEHGKGFAVVADEVRSLAQKASVASKQIKDLIEDTLGKISVGSELVGDAETSLVESVSLMDDLSETMNEIASATSEQTNGIDGLSHSILQIEKITQDNASTVEELAKAAESMSNEAKELSNMLSLFKTPHRKAD